MKFKLHSLAGAVPCTVRAAAISGILASSLGCGGSAEPPLDTVRAETASELQPSGSPVLLETIEADSPAPLPKRAAVVMAEQLRAQELIAQLATPSEDEHAWDAAHHELISLGTPAVAALADALKHGTDVEREIASTTLALLGADAVAAADALESALQDPSEFVRANAAAALVQFPDHALSAAPVLIDMLDAADPQLRQMAAMNLGALGPEASEHVERLTQALVEENTPEVLVPVVELLGRIGPSAQGALPELQKIAVAQAGDVGEAAHNAIQLIKAETTESP